MKSVFLILLLSAAVAAEQPPMKPSGIRFDGETLRYNINWPSGLSLGEVSLSAQKTGARWAFSFQLDAAVPGFAVVERFLSAANDELCSTSFDKDFAHGKRKSKEKIIFDSARSVATRETMGGGKSELQTPACARDPLAYLYHVRKELALGRIPAAQPVFYGAAYQLRLDYTGTQHIRVSDSMVEADRLVGSLKGPASDHTFEIFFAKDAARTPVLVRVPLPLASFTMELVR